MLTFQVFRSCILVATVLGDTRGKQLHRCRKFYWESSKAEERNVYGETVMGELSEKWMCARFWVWTLLFWCIQQVIFGYEKENPTQTGLNNKWNLLAQESEKCRNIRGSSCDSLRTLTRFRPMFSCLLPVLALRRLAFPGKKIDAVILGLKVVNNTG